MSYYISVLRTRNRWVRGGMEKSDELEIYGSMSCGALKFPTAERCEEICVELGLEYYKIFKANEEALRDEVVKTSPKAEALEKRDQEEAVLFDIRQKERGIELSRLPEFYPFKKYVIRGKEVEIFLVRTTPEYNPRMSSEIKCSVSTRVKAPGEDGMHFAVERYFASNGRFQKLTLQRDLIRRLVDGDYYHRDNLENQKAVEPIVNDWKALGAEYERVKRVIHAEMIREEE